MRRSHRILAGLFWGACCSGSLFVFLSVGFLLSKQSTTPSVQTGKVAGAMAEMDQAPQESIVPFASLTKSQSYADFDIDHISADALVVLDAKTSDILLSKDDSTPHPIASLSKLVTALFLMDRGFDDNARGTVSFKRDAGKLSSYGISTIASDDAVSGLSVGQPSAFGSKELFTASLVASANNATFALVESQGLTAVSFQAEIAEYLSKNRFTHTSMHEPTGLDARNASTAHELARIARRAFSYPEIRAITQLESATVTSEDGKAYVLPSTNRLLSGTPITILGGKTGFLEEAQYTFIILTKHITGREIIIVLLGSDSSEQRFQETREIIEWLNRSYL